MPDRVGHYYSGGDFFRWRSSDFVDDYDFRRKAQRASAAKL